jgi:hypothetical protein
MNSDDTPTVYGSLFYSLGGVDVSAANDVILAEKEVVLTAPPLWDAGYAGWEEVSLYYVALLGDSSIGERLGVKLSVPIHEPWLNGYQVLLDNVRVDWVEAVQAYDPFPDDGARDVAKNVNLGWKPGVKTQPTAGHMVYFGTDETAVDDATTSSSEYQSTQDGNSWNASGLELGRTYYWRVDEVNSLEGDSPWKGEVWSFEVTGYATNPSPADGAIDVPFLNQSLSWTAGTEATSHDVYLGTDEDDVANATTSSPEFKVNQGGTSYPLTGLMVGETYYWRIDERSAVHPSGLKGDIWRFTVGNFLIVENFESYNNDPELYAVWDDYWVNGLDGEMFLETDPLITRTQLSQAAKLRFLNETAVKGAQVGSRFDVQDLTELEIGSDWTVGGVKSLSLWLRGDPCNSQVVTTWAAAQPWIELEDTSNNTGYVLHPNPSQMGDEWWREWNIDLGIFDACGVELTAIDRFSIGIGGNAKTGQGKAMTDYGYIYVDDMRLYPPRCFPELAQQAGNFNGDCIVDEFDLDIMADNWLVSDYNTQATPPVNLPEVWYKFDEGTGKTIVRNHGNWGDEYDITVPSTDAPSWTSDVPGVLDPNDPNYAMDFDGDDYLEIPNSPSNQFVGTQNMTITAWVKPEATMGQWDFPSIVESRVDRGEATMKASGFGFGQYNKLIYWWNNDYWDWSAGGSHPYPDYNLWSFTAVAVEPTQATLYHGDGNSVTGWTNVATHGALVDWDTTYTNYIGVNSNNADPNLYNTFQGKIDDLRLYNKTLTIGEIMGIAGVAGEVYVPNNSVANIAPKTPPPTNYDPNDPDIVNFEDYDVLAENWFNEILWP